MLTFWLSCVNYALGGEFPLLHRLLQDIFTYALFWLPRVNLSLKNKLLYYTILFSWYKRLVEPKLLCDECSVNPYNFFFAKVTTLFLNAFPSYQTHRHWSLTCSKLCIVVHRKELVKLSFPLLQFTFNKKKTKSYKKVKFVYLRMSITVKAKALSCWIFEKVPNENCTPLTAKKTKSRRQNKLENPAKKERGKGK